MGKQDVNWSVSKLNHPDAASTYRPWCHVGDLGIDLTGPECSADDYDAVVLELPAGGALAEAVEDAWPGWLGAIDAAQGQQQLPAGLPPLPYVDAPGHGSVACRWLGWLRLKGV